MNDLAEGPHRFFSKKRNYKLCFTARFFEMTTSMRSFRGSGQSAKRYWVVLFAVLAFLLTVAVVASGGSAVFIGIALLLLVLFALSLSVDLILIAFLLGIVALWCTISLTALADLVVYFRVLTKPQNRIALIINGVNLVFAGMIAWALHH